MQREKASTAGFRRRLPLELAADELELLERQQRRFPSKRATLVAGLEALARQEQLKRELAALAAEREQAYARTAELERQAAKAEKAAAKSREETGKAQRDRQAQERTQ